MTTNGPTPPGWYPDNQGTIRWWDGATFTERTQSSPPGYGGSPATPPPNSGGNKPWYKRWWVWAIAAVVIIAAVAGGGSGGDEGDADPVASDENTAKTESTPNDPKGKPTPEPEPEPEPEPKWMTVGKLSGNTNKAGPDFHLDGCDIRMTYNVQGDATSTIVAFYLMDSGTQLMEDGGFPVAQPTKTGPGETTLRKDEGDYYIEVVAANAEWTVQVQEKC
ncbi:DUF2510 domain-containing protein [Nocardioides pacificus]